ncbi:hypothetical protein [Sphingomonas sp.]|uniref:hypothetical protein n=1 Tax=Sphingomonas sp. TaxID=28214 RepID=UPI001B0A78F5|nr:hypothetical protein [Sphingomonas sp.]MBO9714065.1 hypothetical protein [Sphingomonas sp.]
MRLIVFAAALLAALPAAAQPPQEVQSDEDIVVVGSPKWEKRIGDFVGAVSGPNGATDPISRLDGPPACPEATGLSVERNAAITKRMRRIASAAGIKVGAPGCAPNVLLIAAKDKKAMVEALKHDYPIYFVDGRGEAVDPPVQPGPVTAWHVERVIDRRGVIVPYNSEARYYELESSIAGSHTHAAVRKVFIGAVIVVELDALVGLSVNQIADYASMRAYADVEPAKLQRLSAPTILSVIAAPDGTVVPDSVTDWDLTYLRALYAGGPFVPASTARSTIHKRMIDVLKKGKQ